MATEPDVRQIEPAPARSSPRPEGGLSLASEGAWLAATMLASFVVAAILLQLWDLKLHIPITADADGLLSYAAVKGMVEHGWYLHNPSLGAPLGAHLNDFSGFDGDTLQWMALRVMALFTSDPGTLINVYFLLGFPLVAGVAFAVLRALGISRPTAAVCGVIYSALHYHFAHSEAHLFLASYVAVPATCWLVMRILLGRPLLGEGTGWRARLLTPLSLGTAAAVLLSAGSTLYYAVFAIILLFGAAGVAFASGRGRASGVAGLVAAVAVGGLLVVNLAPGLVYQFEHGHNDRVATRKVSESIRYSSSLAQTVLPVPGHRIPALDNLQARFTSQTTQPTESGTQIGLVLSLSLCGLLIALVARALAPDRPRSPRTSLATAAGVGLLMTLLLATTSGVGVLIATIVSPQIRAWDRLTPFIAFFALIGLALALDTVTARLRRRDVGRLLPGAVVVLVGVVALFDQTTPEDQPTYRQTAVTWRSDGRFVAAIEARVPARSMILQLPLHAFPEARPQNDTSEYDLFRGYAHSRTLRWSYGAMRGRPEDWSAAVHDRPVATIVRQAVAAGFAGVYVDRYAYPRRGAVVEGEVERALGVRGPAVVSDDGRLAYFDASRLAARQDRRLTAAQRTALGDRLIDAGSATGDS